ncbi:MAG: DMT family transporter [Defluviitaleaceae bacterium]|nr:DMT family transporter [Defluviitaleaceae bacterium]
MSPKIYLIISALMFGSIGVVTRDLPFESEMISLSRSVLGALFVCFFCLITKKKIDLGLVKKNLIWLIISGAALGINWVFLFESYQHINISTAIVCYYLAPVIVTATSPIFLKEKLSFGSVACVLAALLGLVLVTGIGTDMAGNLALGVTYAVSAAVLYAAIIIINKKIVDLGGIERTLFQLGISAAVMLPYVALTDTFPTGGASLWSIAILLFAGIVLTGVVYLFFFSAVDKVNAQAISVILYIDPITAIILSSIILSERMSLIQIFGTILILGATFVNEVVLAKHSNKPIAEESV